MKVPLHDSTGNRLMSWSNMVFAATIFTRISITRSFSCSEGDRLLLGATFGQDYWTCIESTSTMSQLQECILSTHPNMPAVSASCSYCISSVFLLGGSDCVIDCRRQSNSDACIACRGTIANRWYQQCVPKASAISSPYILLVLMLLTAAIIT